MKKKKDVRSELPLADMHGDGVHFDPKALAAKQNEKAQSNKNPTTKNNTEN